MPRDLGRVGCKTHFVIGRGCRLEHRRQRTPTLPLSSLPQGHRDLRSDETGSASLLTRSSCRQTISKWTMFSAMLALLKDKVGEPETILAKSPKSGSRITSDDEPLFPSSERGLTSRGAASVEFRHFL
ncbi:related to Gluconolactonase [Sporisorium scitamineum]|uniref:Related to Gluconolactonase n=1 Tax=Sporisorium scitamineum TaxID=49012 RepID=A0A127Z9C8_9BASI|nr:related to Gluconolactonase [Sporisorium scitamineum]